MEFILWNTALLVLGLLMVWKPDLLWKLEHFFSTEGGRPIAVYRAVGAINKCKIQNAKCKIIVPITGIFQSFPKEIPSFCILHSAFCIISVYRCNASVN